MKIYVAHSTEIDYQYGLYKPLRESELAKAHTFVFAHEGWGSSSTKSTVKSCDVMLAEVSKPSTGMGIEMGWADDARVPIICVYKAGAKPSDALKHVTREMIEYYTTQELIDKVTQALERL